MRTKLNNSPIAPSTFISRLATLSLKNLAFLGHASCVSLADVHPWTLTAPNRYNFSRQSREKKMNNRCVTGLLNLAPLLFLFALSGCGADKLPKYPVVQGLRVLSLNTDHPEINYDGSTFSSTIQVTPWISDLYGNGRTLKTNAYWCVDPGVGRGAVPTCDDNVTKTILHTNQTVATTADFLAPNYTGQISSISLDFSTASSSTLARLSATFLASSANSRYNGFSILFFMEIYPENSTEEKITSFKRIFLSDTTKLTKNQNPTSVEIQKDGVELLDLPNVESELRAFHPTASFESYNQMSTSGELLAKIEEISTTWFLTGPSDVECSKKKECTTDGLFRLTRTNGTELNRFYIPAVSTPTTRGRVLVAVSRDDRGGSVVKKYCSGICP